MLGIVGNDMGLEKKVDRLLGPGWLTMLRSVASDIDLHTGDVECSHALHRHFCRGCLKFNHDRKSMFKTSNAPAAVQDNFNYKYVL
jgi:hypothetical protein